MRNRACQIAREQEPMAEMCFESDNERAAVASVGLAPNPSVHFLEQGSRRSRALALLLMMAALLTLRSAAVAGSAASGKRCAFIGITKFSRFSKSAGALTNEIMFTSPVITAPIDWDELVVSWNVSPGVHLKGEARAIYPSHATRYYTMGLWSDDPAQFSRESVRRQRDEDGSVKMDTLILRNATRKMQLRITAGGGGGPRMLKFLGLSFCNRAVPATLLPPNRAAWGKVL